MSVLDKAIAAIAPVQCIACSVEGQVLCSACLASAGEPHIARCGGCRKLSKGSRTCTSCRSWLRPYAVHVATAYEGLYERLLHEYKFEVRRQAVGPIVAIMNQITVSLPVDTVVCYVPTASSRIRERGFDHAKLLAKMYAASNQASLVHALGRSSNTRQLGANRSKRIQQMQHEFFVNHAVDVKGKEILLLDDVMTTGASLSSATTTLLEAGARRVHALVFAQKV